MYYQYWSLKKPPFDNVPDPSMYVDSHESVENAIAETLFAIEEGNECIAVIVGDVGLGKTLSLRMIIDSLNHDKYRIAFITNPDMSFVQLLREIVGQLTGEQCERKRKVELLETFNKLLFEVANEGKKVLVFIDEANAMSPANLESLRLLTNMQDDERNLFTIILAGQLELAKRLEHPKRANLFQRIGTYSHIAKMDREELVQNYVETRLKLAGGTKMVFTQDAIKALWEYSEHGVPRLINKLCKLSLKAGETNGFEEINKEIIEAIGERFQKLSGPAVQKRRPRTRSADDVAIQDELEDLQDRTNGTSPVRIPESAALESAAPEQFPIEVVEEISEIVPSETQGAEEPEQETEPEQEVGEEPAGAEAQVNGFGIHIEIPPHVLDQARLSSEDHRMKLAGALAAQTLEKNPQLTATHNADPVAIWHEIRDKILALLEPERKVS